MPARKKRVEAKQDQHPSRLQVVELRPAEVEVAAPPPPKGVLKSTADAWASYWASEVSRAADQGSDLPALERWALVLDEYTRAMRELRGSGGIAGRMALGSTGQIVMHPLTGYAQQLAGQLDRLETSLGMTPLARLKLGLTGAQVQLTAAQLNDALRDQGAADDGADAIDAEGWEEVS